MEHIDGITVIQHAPEGSVPMGASVTHYGPEETAWRVNGLTQERAIALRAVSDEVERSKMHEEQFASLHEAWAVIFEELDEIWDITRLKRRDRDREKLRTELIQLAAMAIKAIHSMDNFVGGKV